MAAMYGAIAASRRPRWQYPPPPTPRIIHLPRRPRRRTHPKAKKEVPPPPSLPRRNLGKLETLFGQERAFSKQSVPIVVLEEKRRERVEERGGSSELAVNGGGDEEKWRFQAEILRAECNLLRMEKEVAAKKLERARVKIQRALRSVVHSIVSEREKIGEGESSRAELEGGIQQLAERIERLRRSLEDRPRKCRSSGEQEAVLRKDTKLFGGVSDEINVKKIQEMAEVSLSIKTACRAANESFVSSDDSNVEILRRKMEGLSNGMLLERMREECGSMLSTANSSVSSSASTSKRIEFVDSSSSSTQQSEKKKNGDESICSGRCKAVVRRILAQVRAETEQWSQMQEMLGQVREEMEELQSSRDFWEDRAVDYDHQMQALNSDVREWKQKAIASENKANQLEAQMYFVRKELESAKRKDDPTARSSPPRMAVDGQHEMEKQVLICRLKENRVDNKVNHCNHRGNGAGQSIKKQIEVVSSEGRRRKALSERVPLGDVGNLSIPSKQRSKAVFPLMPSRASKHV